MPELVSVLKQMGQQFKWPQKMKAHDSFRNPGHWCDFHRDHGHKTEDSVALGIEVTEILKKGYLREFLSEKAKGHLNKEHGFFNFFKKIYIKKLSNFLKQK